MVTWQSFVQRATVSLFAFWPAIHATAFTILDYPGSVNSRANGIDGGTIVGWQQPPMSPGATQTGYRYDGVYGSLKYPGSLSTTARDVSGGRVVGTYQDGTTFTDESFIYDDGSWSNLKNPGYTYTYAESVDGGRVAGWLASGPGSTTGFIYDGNWTLVNYPGSAATRLFGIDGGNVVGTYRDASANTHGFLHNGTTWTTIDFPGASFTQPRAISGNNIVGSYVTPSGVTRGFRYDGRFWHTLGVSPGTTSSSNNGIDGETIVGEYTMGGVTHGFSTPVVPEASNEFKFAVQAEVTSVQDTDNRLNGAFQVGDQVNGTYNYFDARYVGGSDFYGFAEHYEYFFALGGTNYFGVDPAPVSLTWSANGRTYESGRSATSAFDYVVEIADNADGSSPITPVGDSFRLQTQLAIPENFTDMDNVAILTSFVLGDETGAAITSKELPTTALDVSQFASKRTGQITLHDKWSYEVLASVVFRIDSITAVPEPASGALFVLGILGFGYAFAGRRRVAVARGLVVAAAFGLALFTSESQATMLTFDQFSDPTKTTRVANDLPANQSYGDNVADYSPASAIGGQYVNYGADGGFTPNISTEYSWYDTLNPTDPNPANNGPGGVNGWNFGYGGLSYIIYANPGFPLQTRWLSEVQFTPAPGYSVRINSFDYAGFQAAQGGQTLKILANANSATPQLLWSAGGDGTVSFPTTAAALTPAITGAPGQTVSILWGYSDRSGIDNISFSEVSLVPEPSTGFCCLVVGIFVTVVSGQRRPRAMGPIAIGLTVVLSLNNNSIESANALTYEASFLNLPIGDFDIARASGASGASFAGSGYGAITNGNNHALFWPTIDSDPVDLHPAGFEWSSAIANKTSPASQVGTGYFGPTASGAHALLWHGTAASVVDLHPEGYHFSAAVAAAGNVQVGAGQLTETSIVHALMWRGSAESVVNLHPVGFHESGASGAWGEYQIGYASNHALLWHGSATDYVDLHPAEYDATYGVALDGNSQVGHGFTNGEWHPLLWHGTAASVIDLMPAGFTHVFAHDVAGGYQVGAGQGVSTNYETHAIVWRGTAESAIDLHASLAALGINANSSTADVVTEDGRVFGTASVGDTFYSIVWSPVFDPLPGDYNQNGIVDAADYSVWRDHVGQLFDLPNRNPGLSGPIVEADFDFWKSNFGEQVGSGLSSLRQVPEPATLTTCTAIFLTFVTQRRGKSKARYE